MSATRRQVLRSLALAGASQAIPRALLGAEPGPVCDFHVHLFGVGDGGSGCFLSPEAKAHWTYAFLTRLLGLRQGRMDADYLEALLAQLGASPLASAVLLAYDGRYDERGHFLEDETNVYVPNDYLFRTVARAPEQLIPCISINPRRRDARDELDRCAEMGARVLKIHPPTQDVDPGEPRFRPFYRRVAEHGIVLMVHTGMEHASEVTTHAYSDPARLLPALEEGCTVVAAHAGTGGYFDAKEDYGRFIDHLVDLMKRFPRLYCDTAVLASNLRWRNLPELEREPMILERMIHASDWPFPSNALVFWSRLGTRRVIELSSITNLFERDYRLKKALHVPAKVFTGGATLLES